LRHEKIGRGSPSGLISSVSENQRKWTTKRGLDAYKFLSDIHPQKL
jgi:hypothetical protein